MKRIAAILALLVGLVAVVAVTSGANDDGGAYKVRAIFDNASFLGPDDDVKASGVIIGKVAEVDLTEDNKAAVVVQIDNPAFQDFRKDASCIIRPQSLIGERFIECKTTQPRPASDPPPPELPVIPEGQPGAGQRLLPVSQTTTPVDIDLIVNIMERPYAERLAIILNELGVGLAANGDELRRVIRNLDPALAATDRVLKILAEQNRVLANLARDSDRILAPLARQRANVAGFITEAGETAEATSERQAAMERTLELLPEFLRELDPTLRQLGEFSDQTRPLLADLRSIAPDLNRLNENLGPFAAAATPAIESLGDAARVGRPALNDVRSDVDLLRSVATNLEPLADNLNVLLSSLKNTGTIPNVLRYLYFQATAINGFDQFSHFLRAGLSLNAACGALQGVGSALCWGNFTPPPGDSPGAEAHAAELLKQAKEDAKTSKESGGARGPEPKKEPKKEQGSNGGSKETGGTSGEATTGSKSTGGSAPSVDTPKPSPPAGAPSPEAGALDYLLGSEGEE